MDGYSTTVFLFLACIVGSITYALVPSLPITILAAASSVVLAAILWWHWTQFSVEYRMSTWQEGLRNYASYFLVFLVMVLTYGYYVFSRSGGSLAEVAQKAQTTMRNAGRNALNRSSRAIAEITAPKTNAGIFPSFSSNFVASASSPVPAAPTPTPAPESEPATNILRSTIGF